MSETLRVPPHSTEAEQAVIGAVLLVPEAFHRVGDSLDPADFYRGDHRAIWEAIMGLARRAAPYDAVTVEDELGRLKLSDRVPAGYVYELATTTPSAANVVAYAAIVQDRAMKRRAIEFGTEVVAIGFDEAADSAEVLATAQRGVMALAPGESGGIVQLSDSLGEFFADLQDRYQTGVESGLLTPWGEFNKHSHGLPVGVTTVLAARPAMGKSIAGMDIARSVAARGRRVLAFSLEMSKRQMNRRNVAAMGRIPHDWLLRPDADHPDAEAFWSGTTTAAKALKGLPLYVDDRPSITIDQLMARARAFHIRTPVDFLLVDHIHDMKLDARAEARHEYGRIMDGLNVLAKEFNIPVLALAQLNRAASSRTDKRPMMADLRESGNIEQKAGMVLFLHRDDYYNRDSQDRGVVELILEKGRDVEGGRTFRLKNSYAQMRLDDFDDFDSRRTAPTPTPSRNTAGGRVAALYED